MMVSTYHPNLDRHLHLNLAEVEVHEIVKSLQELVALALEVGE